MANQPPWASSPQPKTSSGKSNQSQSQSYNNQGGQHLQSSNQLLDHYKNAQKVYQKTYGEILPGIAIPRKLYNQLALYFVLVLVGMVLMAILVHYFHLYF